MYSKSIKRCLWLIFFALIFTNKNAYAAIEPIKKEVSSEQITGDWRTTLKQKIEIKEKLLYSAIVNKGFKKQLFKPSINENITEKQAKTSFFTSLLSFLMLILAATVSYGIILLIGAILALLAIIFGIKALQKIKKEPTTSKKTKHFAKAGLIIGILFYALIILFFAAVIVALKNFQ